MKKLLIILFLTINLSSSAMDEIFLEHEGVIRSYLLYVPDNINLDDRNDLVIGLHGYTWNCIRFRERNHRRF
jgi:poly(3-hydroxybutyrate) depolymerase